MRKHTSALPCWGYAGQTPSAHQSPNSPTPKQIDSPDTEAPEQPASAEETASKLGVIAALCFLLPVVYVLSTGPVVWAGENGYLPSAMEDQIEAFYWPLKYLLDHWEPFRWLFGQYIQLWIDIP